MKSLHSITFILLVIGGLNWLLLAVAGWDVSKFLGGQTAIIPKIIYILVGLSALYEMFTHKNRCRECAPNGPKSQSGQM